MRRRSLGTCGRGSGGAAAAGEASKAVGVRPCGSGSSGVSCNGQGEGSKEPGGGRGRCRGPERVSEGRRGGGNGGGGSFVMREAGDPRRDTIGESPRQRWRLDRQRGGGGATKAGGGGREAITGGSGCANDGGGVQVTGRRCRVQKHAEARSACAWESGREQEGRGRGQRGQWRKRQE